MAYLLRELRVRYLGKVIAQTCLPGLCLAGLAALSVAGTVPLVGGVIFDRPSDHGSPTCAPSASGLSWNDAARWEYASRAGTRTPFSSGANPPAPETANRLFDATGKVTAESRWRGKNLLDGNVNGRLP